MSKEVFNPFAFKVKAQDGKRIESEGHFPVKAARAEIIDSNTKDLKGTASDKVRSWKDKTLQVLFTFVGIAGMITERFSLMGFRKYAELSDEEKLKCINDEATGYAISKKTGNRIVSETATAKCQEILSGVITAIGVPSETEINSEEDLILAIHAAMEQKNNLMISVRKNEYGRLEVKKVWRSKDSAEIPAVDATTEDEEF